jgi:FkbM family methyltransferase
MRILQNKINVSGEDIFFHHLDNDETFFGAIAGLQQDVFGLSKIRFNNNDIFIDFGCNVGIISLVLAKLYPNIKIYAFDASEIAIQCLKYSVNKNNFTNIYPFHLAVGAKNEYVNFTYEKDHFSCLMQEDFKNQDEFRVTDKTVKKIKVDEIFDSNLLNIDKVKFLKCDIEGGEYEIFNHLLQNRQDILNKIEFLNLELHLHDQFAHLRDDLKLKIKQIYKDKVIFQ